MQDKTGFTTVENSPQELDELEEKIKKHRHRTVGRAVAAVAVIVLLIVGIQLWLQLRTYSSYEELSLSERRDSAAASYASFQGNILEYDNDGIVCHDTEDSLLWNQSFEMTSPELSVCGKYLAVYDRGGTSVYIMSVKGLVKQMEMTMPIKRVCIARQGTIAVLLKEGSSSYVRLYDRTGKELASGEYYEEKASFPVDIALSADAQKLAVDLLDASGGKVCSTINFYNFSSVGQNEIDNIVGTYSYEDVFISELVYAGTDKLLAVADTGLYFFEGAQKPAEKKTVAFEQEIQSVFHNEKYVGVSSSSTEEEGCWNIRVYDMSGNVVMENDTDIAYKSIELLDNNEICVRDDYSCELFTIHSIKKFSYTFDEQLYKILSGADAQSYIFVLNGGVEAVRLQ